MEVIQVNARNVGRIIGSRGANIREMQETSQARIQVSRDEAVNGQTAVTITGTEDQIAVAKKLIEQCQNNDDRAGFSDRDSRYGGGQRERRGYRGDDRDSWRDTRNNDRDEGDWGRYGGQRGMGRERSSQGNGWGGRSDRNNAWGGGRGNRNDSYEGDWRGSTRNDSRDNWGGSSGGGFASRGSRDNDFGGGAGSGGSREEIYVLSIEAGRLIGAGGSRIKELQNDSNCRIKIAREGADGVNLVELFGTPENIEDAKQLISKAVDIVDCNGTRVDGDGHDSQY